LTLRSSRRIPFADLLIQIKLILLMANDKRFLHSSPSIFGSPPPFCRAEAPSLRFVEKRAVFSRTGTDLAGTSADQRRIDRLLTSADTSISPTNRDIPSVGLS
jgi:hypothetical protein